MPQNGFVWAKALITLYGRRPAYGTPRVLVPKGNVAMKGGVGSKNDRRAGTHFFEPGGYKIEPLTKMVNDDI